MQASNEFREIYNSDIGMDVIGKFAYLYDSKENKINLNGILDGDWTNFTTQMSNELISVTERDIKSNTPIRYYLMYPKQFIFAYESNSPVSEEGYYLYHSDYDNNSFIHVRKCVYPLS